MKGGRAGHLHVGLRSELMTADADGNDLREQLGEVRAFRARERR